MVVLIGVVERVAATADVDAVTGPVDHDGPRAGLIRFVIFDWVTSPLDRPRARNQP